MFSAEPHLSSVVSSAPSRGQISYPEVAAKAWSLANSIKALAANKSDRERRRLLDLSDDVVRIQTCLVHVGVL